MFDEGLDDAICSRLLDYERLLGAGAISEAIYTHPWESVLIRNAFRWKRDGQVVPNAYESHSMEQVCEDRNWNIIARYGDHIAIISENTQAQPQPAAAKGGAMSDTVEYCECRNWCRDGRDMLSPHHPRCDKYTPQTTDPRFARFGEAMWRYITKLGGDFCGEEMSEDILPLAQAAGLCSRVKYDPAKHGGIIEAEPGDEIWWWGADAKGGSHDA